MTSEPRLVELRENSVVVGARAIEYLRGIGDSDFMVIFPLGNKPIEEIEAGLLPAATPALDNLVWCAKATLAACAPVA